MRVAGSTITQALIDTQSDVSKTPYIYIYINSTDYSSRLLYLEHHEEPYRERAVIGLSNRDNSLDDLDLDGKEFEIGYGYDSSGHSGSATDKVDTATLWVKSHQIISIQGERIYQIYAEGMWSRLRVEKILPGVTAWKASTAYIVNQSVPPTKPNGHKYVCIIAGTSGATEPTWPTSGTVEDGTAPTSIIWSEDGIANPYSNVFLATHTVEELIQIVIEAMGWTWTTVADSDGIIDVFKPMFDIGQGGYEPGAAIIYRLIWMTKSYLRAMPSKTFETVFPQTSDAVNETYYSNQAPWFIEYNEQSKLLEPNSILVLCNQDPNMEWGTDAYPLMYGTASDTDQIAKYVEIVEPFLAGNIRDQTDADNRADAILTRLKAETLGGRCLLPFHDCRVELYDKISVLDYRT